MLFFVDESWQATCNNKYKVGVLAAVQLKSHDFNDCSNQIYSLKIKHLGIRAIYSEIKGKEIFKNYLFKLESQGIRSNGLNLARDIFDYINSLGTRFFASIVFSKEEIDLACADVNQLERPFFFLFERIDLFMKENYPGLMAKLIFDDRGYQSNEKISKSVSNFFHKSRVGQSFSTIIKSPYFAISGQNVGIQLADMGAHILGDRFTGDRAKIEFFNKIKELEFISRKLIEVEGKTLRLKGFKVVKEKEAGDLFSPGRTK